MKMGQEMWPLGVYEQILRGPFDGVRVRLLPGQRDPHGPPLLTLTGRPLHSHSYPPTAALATQPQLP